jgi:hypothetical protein
MYGLLTFKITINIFLIAMLAVTCNDVRLKTVVQLNKRFRMVSERRETKRFLLENIINISIIIQHYCNNNKNTILLP